MNMRSSSGLSILELLLALALLAAISVGLMASTSLSAKMLDRASALQVTAEQLALRVRLRNWVAQAASPSLVSNLPIAFEGGPQGFQFLSLATTPFAPESAALVIRVNVEANALMLTVTSIDDDGEPVSEWTRSLASNVSDIEIAYFKSGADDPSWFAQWVPEDGLPQLVRISAGQGSVPQWPEFTVRLTYADHATE